MILPSSLSTHHYKTTTTADEAEADCDCDVNNGGFYDTTQYHQLIGQAAGQRITTRQQQQQRRLKYYKVVVWLPIVVIITFLVMNRYHQLLEQTNLSFEELEYHDLYTYIEPVSVSASSSLFSSSSSTITTLSSLTTNSSSSSNSSSKDIKINWKMKNGTTTTTTDSRSSSKSIKINWKKKNGTNKTTTATTRSAITSSSTSPTTNSSSSSSSSNNSSKPLKTKKKKKKRKRKKKHTTTNTTTDDEAASFSYYTTSGFVLWRNYNASIMSDGNLMIEFFNSTTNNNKNDDVKSQTQKAQTQGTNNNADGFSACLINLEDTIRLTEWIPYHYTILPLTSLVIAMDPKTSELGLNRTLRLIELWSNRIQITVWPSYTLPQSKRFRPEQSYIRERQVYFANSCLIYHSTFTDTRSWTLLTDNDEYLIYNYPHLNIENENKNNGTTITTIDKGEYIHYDHPSYKKKKIQQEIKLNRRKYMHWRFPTGNNNHTSNNNIITENSTDNNNNNNTNNHSQNNQNTLPMKLNQTIFQFITQNQNQLQLPICVRIPGIHYGGPSSVDDDDNDAPAAAVSYLNSMSSSLPSSSSSSSLSWLTSLSSTSLSSKSSSKSSVDNILTTIDPTILSTYRYIYHEKRKSKFSKVMIDVSRINASSTVLEWSKSNHAKTIHNPNRILCGYNGVVDSGTDYYSSLFRVNHYIGSVQSYLERKDDYRSRSIELYQYKFQKIINVTKNPYYYDYDILPWMDLFLNKCHHNLTLVNELLFLPLREYNK